MASVTDELRSILHSENCQQESARTESQARSEDDQSCLLFPESDKKTKASTLQHSPFPRGKSEWRIELQPDVPQVSQENLAAEVKDIYARLAVAEAKSIEMDSHRASHPDEPIDANQWQDLVAIHRTLLYEHHNFLMATQHPLANPILLGLATKYSIPARMWRHGIYAFLEVLRQRRPESQEHMLAFIYLAYQMVSVLLETVAGFADTWIECLGDLARYRMAIEEDIQTHTMWGHVASRWYAMAADRRPSVGRLYHHSGILERPSLRKFYLYTRALTSVIPFTNAEESVRTLCIPMLEDEDAGSNTQHSTEAMIMRFHAGIFLSRKTEHIEKFGKRALSLLTDQNSSEFARHGVSLAVINIAALFGFGSADNVHRQLYASVFNTEIFGSPSPREHESSPQSSDNGLVVDLERAQQSWTSGYDFCFGVFNDTMRRAEFRDSLSDFLPYMQVTLVFLHSTNTLRSRLTSAETNMQASESDLFDSTRIDWTALARSLNFIARFYPITPRTRATRVLYLGMVLTQMTACLDYDRRTRRFFEAEKQMQGAMDTGRSSDELRRRLRARATRP